MTTPTKPLTDRERIDVLLDRITELEASLIVGNQALHMEQEEHRLTRERFERYALEVGHIVTERGEAEEIVLVCRQFMEEIKESQTKTRILEVIRMLRDGLQEPLPRETRERRKWASD